MLFDNVSIASVVNVDAPHRVTSADLEARLAPTMKRLGIMANLLEGLSGIKARRMWNEGEQPSDAATLAGEKAIADAGIDRSKIGVLINTSVCRDFIEPSVACIVHSHLGLDESCLNFDLGNACLGFLNGMEVVATMIERGQIEYGLVVDGENSRYVVDKTIERLLAPDTGEADFRQNFATLTLGSGATAMVLGHKDSLPGGHVFRGGVSLAASQHHKLCRGQVDHMVTDTRGLLVEGIQLAYRTLARAKEVMGWRIEDLSELILHQVSKSHTEKLAQALDLDLEKVLPIYPEYGNVGPAAVPMTLAKTAEMGRVEPGDRIALMGIGSGLNCTMAEIIW